MNQHEKINYVEFPAKDMEAIANIIVSNLERNVLVSSQESGLTGLFKRLMEHF